MAKQLINIGTTDNDGTGDSIRRAFDLVNSNFTEVYSALSGGDGIYFTNLIGVPNPLQVSGANTNITLLVTGETLTNTTVTQRTLVVGSGLTLSSSTSGIIRLDLVPASTSTVTNFYLETDINQQLIDDLKGNGYEALNFADPISNTSLATKQYVDAHISTSSIYSYQVGVADYNSPPVTSSTSTYVDPFFTHATIGVSTSTVVARDKDGNLYANKIYASSDVYATIFHGTATSAYYADLAELYLPDAEYDPGTVLIFGGKNEVTASSSIMDKRIAGVVSTNPAYIMNSHLINGVAVALTGRVPCKVIGKVRKGDMLISSHIAGVAMALDTPVVGSIIGKSLGEYESSDIVGLIEVVVGRV